MLNLTVHLQLVSGRFINSCRAPFIYTQTIEYFFPEHSFLIQIENFKKRITTLYFPQKILSSDMTTWHDICTNLLMTSFLLSACVWKEGNIWSQATHTEQLNFLHLFHLWNVKGGPFSRSTCKHHVPLWCCQNPSDTYHPLNFGKTDDSRTC